MPDPTKPRPSTASEKAIERYKSDAIFATLVNLLVQAALNHQYTAGEMRDAAYVAALRIEEMTVTCMVPELGRLVPRREVRR